MGSCPSSDADGVSGASASLFGNSNRPSSYSDLKVVLTHAPIDSTKPYNFWVQAFDKDKQILNPGEPKKVKIASGKEGVVTLHDLPSRGGYFVQLMTGDRKEHKVRGAVYVNNAATKSDKGGFAELVYPPIFPNEWLKNESQTLLSIWISLNPNEKKSRSMWFRACDENGVKLKESKPVKTIVNDGTSPKVELRAWVPSASVKTIELYARFFTFSANKPIATFSFPQACTTTHCDGFDLEGKPLNLTQREVPGTGMRAPTTKITVDNLEYGS